MPAQSQQQQKLFGLALAFKRGEVPASEVSDEIKAIADRMSEKEIEDFASTKHKGLPKMKEQLRKIVREIIREKVISEMELSKDEMDKLHSDGEVEVDGEKVTYDESINEEKPGLWANIRAKRARGEKPAHGNSQAHKDAVKAGKKINKEESVNEASTDRDFEKVYSIFDKKDYFGLKGSIKTMLGNWQRALDKGDKGAQQYSKEDIIDSVTAQTKARAKHTYDELVNAINKKDIKSLKSKLRHDQPFSLMVFAQVTGKKLPKSTRDIHSFLDNEFMNESVNESASKEAMGIAGFTGTRGSAVQDFIDKHELDAAKLFKSIKTANLKGRLNFVSALVGKDGNPNQRLTIKLHKKNESVVNEGKYDGMLDVIEDLVSKANSFMDVGNQLKKHKVKYSFSTSMIPMYTLDKLPIAIVNKKYVDKADREVGDIAIGLMESINESLINESPSSEELRIVMMAVRKIAKYRNVPIDQSINDVLNAAEQLEMDIKKGKIKK